MYIIPEKLCSNWQLKEKKTKIITFAEIAERYEIPELATDFLRKIDSISKNSSVKNKQDIYADLYENIITICSRSGKTPDKVQHSMSSDRPNYTVSFTDGSCQNFYYSGTEYKRSKAFNSAKMEQWVDWDVLCNAIKRANCFA